MNDECLHYEWNHIRDDVPGDQSLWRCCACGMVYAWPIGRGPKSIVRGGDYSELRKAKSCAT